MKHLIFFSIFLCLAIACGKSADRTNSSNNNTTKGAEYTILRTIEHDRNAFTQGLVYHNHKLLESTGGDSSWIAEYDVETAAYARKAVLDETYFGEGITVLNNKVYQLTWKSNIGFVYDLSTFDRIGSFSYDFEGWGITHDHQHLIISDGTDKLHYFDTLTLTKKFTKSISQDGRKAFNLNELEFIDGYVYANQWESNAILKIDTGSASIVKTYDFSYLAREAKRANPQADVLNGIAYNKEMNVVYLTGKLWPFLYVIRLNE